MVVNRSYLSRIRPILQLPIVSAGAILFTWGMCVLSAPPSLWIGSGLVVLYLIWAGRAGIFPASIWISLLILFAIVNDERPDFFFEGRSLYRLWSMGLTLAWTSGVSLVYFLGHHGETCARYPSKLCQQLRHISCAAILVGHVLGQLLVKAGI